jgi:abhydrolase domain-containing protein 5
MVSFSIEDYVYHTFVAKASGELCLKYIFSLGAFARMPLLHRSGDPNHFKVAS